jgi:hypothetical protein
MSNAGGFKTLNRYADMLAGNATFVPSSFDSIATVNITTTGIQEVNFTSIPQTYRHLQLRVMMKADSSSTPENYYLSLNGDTGFNYAIHKLIGNGSAASVDGAGTGSFNGIGPNAVPSNNQANVYAVSIYDILDYKDTNKNTTARGLHGYDANGSGQIVLQSGLWLNTAAVTALRWWRPTNIKPNSSFALYGIKG